jgi:sugar-phosphatase
MKNSKAIIFDMDGVLIDSEPFWGQASMEVMERVGIPYTRDDVMRYQGVRIGDIVSRVWDENPVSYSKEEIEGMVCDRVSELVLESGRVLPGIDNILQKAVKLGLRIGLATSTPRRVAVNFIKRVGIGESIEVMCTGEEVAYGKPHPEIYILCAERLGVEPWECIVFEDSVNGVVAAKAARMYTVAVPAPEARGDKRYGIADVKLDTLEDFTDDMIP